MRSNLAPSSTTGRSFGRSHVHNPSPQLISTSSSPESERDFRQDRYLRANDDLPHLFTHNLGLGVALTPIHAQSSSSSSSWEGQGQDMDTAKSIDGSVSESHAPGYYNGLASAPSTVGPDGTISHSGFSAFAIGAHCPPSNGTPSIISSSSMPVPGIADVPALIFGCACRRSPSSFCDHCTISADGADTDLASAVSGMLISDEDNSGEFTITRSAQYECPFHYLNCSFATDDKERWLQHCPIHFKNQGPPVFGSKCPLCDFRADETMIPPDDRLKAEDLGKARRRAYRRNPVDKMPAPPPPAELRQARALWGVRQEHVAMHHEQGFSLAAATPDFVMFTHLRNQRLISDATYKDLTVSDKEGGPAEPVTSVGGGRQERR